MKRIKNILLSLLLFVLFTPLASALELDLANVKPGSYIIGTYVFEPGVAITKERLIEALKTVPGADTTNLESVQIFYKNTDNNWYTFTDLKTDLTKPNEENKLKDLNEISTLITHIFKAEDKKEENVQKEDVRDELEPVKVTVKKDDTVIDKFDKLAHDDELTVSLEAEIGEEIYYRLDSKDEFVKYTSEFKVENSASPLGKEITLEAKAVKVNFKDSLVKQTFIFNETEIPTIVDATITEDNENNLIITVQGAGNLTENTNDDDTARLEINIFKLHDSGTVLPGKGGTNSEWLQLNLLANETDPLANMDDQILKTGILNNFDITYSGKSWVIKFKQDVRSLGIVGLDGDAHAYSYMFPGGKYKFEFKIKYKENSETKKSNTIRDEFLFKYGVESTSFSEINDSFVFNFKAYGNIESNYGLYARIFKTDLVEGSKGIGCSEGSWIKLVMEADNGILGTTNSAFQGLGIEMNMSYDNFVWTVSLKKSAENVSFPDPRHIGTKLVGVINNSNHITYPELILPDGHYNIDVFVSHHNITNSERFSELDFHISRPT